jgi:hypothetical protein
VNNPWPGALARRHVGNEPCVAPWYRQTKATKCSGMEDRRRSALIVPKKRGNKRPYGPRGGKRGIGIMESLLGQRGHVDSSGLGAIA